MGYIGHMGEYSGNKLLGYSPKGTHIFPVLHDCLYLNTVIKAIGYMQKQSTGLIWHGAWLNGWRLGYQKGLHTWSYFGMCSSTFWNVQPFCLMLTPWLVYPLSSRHLPARAVDPVAVVVVVAARHRGCRWCRQCLPGKGGALDASTLNKEADIYIYIERERFYIHI